MNFSNHPTAIANRNAIVPIVTKEFNPIANRNPIGINKLKPIVPIANPIGATAFKEKAEFQRIDQLLDICRDLMVADYVKWFAKRFYAITNEEVMRAASESRADGKDARRLFSFLIDKLYNKSNIGNR